MNFLAHAYLAGPDSAMRIGGMIGDFVKGPLHNADLPPPIRAGVALHRAIDSYAETHPAFCRSRARVTPARRRYAGILVDMFYDHCLAQHWSRHHPQPLADYAAAIYALLDTHAEVLPAGFRELLPYMRSGDWLVSYADGAALAAALDRMSRRRLRHANPLAGGYEEFLAAPAGFVADFDEFIVDARAFAAAQRAAAAS